MAVHSLYSHVTRSLSKVRLFTMVKFRNQDRLNKVIYPKPCSFSKNKRLAILIVPTAHC